MEITWPWHFVTPSEEEKLHRRELLDIRGTFAQWSIMIVIILLRVIYQTWNTSSQTKSEAKKPRGPVSWLDRPLVAGWLETRRQYAVCGLWLSWLVGLCVWNSGDGMFYYFASLSFCLYNACPQQLTTRRLPPLDQGARPCRSLPDPLAGFDVACSIHLNLQTICIIYLFVHHLCSPKYSHPVPSTLWPYSYLASDLWTCHPLPLVLCAE